MLTAVGFTPRQLRATILWQAAVGAGVALAVGVPVGIVAGRWLWQAYAADIGVATRPDVPAVAIVVAVVASLAASMLASLIPAARAERSGTAAALRSG